MASSADILRAIGNIIGTATAPLLAAGASGQTIIGWPQGPQLKKIVDNGEWIISIYPQRARPAPNQYLPIAGTLMTPPPCPLTAAVSSPSANLTTIVFGGTNAPGINIHTIAGPQRDALDTLYQTTGSETLAQIATAVAALVNALSFEGIVATASGDTVSVTGSSPVFCNVGQTISARPTTGYPIYVKEVRRFTRDVQVTIWAATPDVNAAYNAPGSRENIESYVLPCIGGLDQAYQYAPDGSAFRALWSDVGAWSDRAEQSYSVLRSDNYLTIEYGLLKPVSATPIGAIKAISQIDNGDPLTQIIGGP